MDWKEPLKQVVSALLAGALPYITGKLSFLPFLNPTIHAELWWITALFAFVAAFYSYNLVRPLRAQTPPFWFIFVGAFGLAIAVLSVFSILWIIDGLIVGTYIRMAYVVCFVGVALVLGAGAGRMFGLEEARDVALRTSIDGSMNIPANVSTALFNGAVPPNGFMVRADGAVCYVNDDGPASAQAGFLVPNGAGLVYVTPPGYKPMGAVRVFCTTATDVVARGW
jgi:hypothetical protein